MARRRVARLVLLSLSLWASPVRADSEAAAAAGPPGGEAETPSYIGVYAQSNSNVLEASNVYDGITVAKVVENSPAAAVGLQEGDILLEANGVVLEAPGRLDDLLLGLEAGSPLQLRIERAGRVEILDLETVARVTAPASIGSAAERPIERQIWIERRRLGIEFRVADPGQLKRYGLSPSFGVELTRVAEASPLRARSIGVGELITAVNGRPVESPESLIEFLAARSDDAEVDLTVVDPGGALREVEVPLYRPATTLTRLSIPLVFSMVRGKDTSEYSAVLGAFRWTRFSNGSRLRLLWLIRMQTGTPDELIDVGGSDS